MLNTEQKILYRSRYNEKNTGFDKLLTDIQDLGPCVFVSPDKACVMTLNGAYVNLFIWDNMRLEYTCHECYSHAGYESLYDMTLHQIDAWCKEIYINFYRSWFDITIDPSTLP